MPFSSFFLKERGVIEGLKVTSMKGAYEENRFPSLDLIFELTKEAIAVQREQVNALDSKANFILGSATAVVSTALVLQAVQQTTPLPQQSASNVYCPIPSSKFFEALPLLLLLLFYLCVIFTAYLAYKNRVYKQVPNPDELYNTYLLQEESKTKAEVFEAMRVAYKDNASKIKNKVSMLDVALVFLGCEAIALVLYLIFQVAC
jgi:hypothetical protein